MKLISAIKSAAGLIIFITQLASATPITDFASATPTTDFASATPIPSTYTHYVYALHESEDFIFTMEYPSFVYKEEGELGVTTTFECPSPHLTTTTVTAGYSDPNGHDTTAYLRADIFDEGFRDGVADYAKYTVPAGPFVIRVPDVGVRQDYYDLDEDMGYYNFHYVCPKETVTIKP